MTIKEMLQKLQNLPLSQRKIILWAIVGMVAVCLFFIWITMLKTSLAKMKGQNIMNSIIPGIQNVNIQNNGE